MATMKTLNGYGFNATELNGKTSDSYLQKTDTASDTSKLGGKAPEYYLQPRNLLDNSDFGNPVNQRGQTNYTTAFAYGIDRWFVGEAGHMWIAEDSPTGKNVAYSTSNDIGISYMWQKVGETLKAGKTYTFAVSFYHSSGQIILTSKATDLGIATSAGSSEPSGIVILTFTPNVDYTVDDGSTFLRIHTSGTIGLNWAALYEGSYTADTLPPYVPKGYAAELAECRLYYRPQQLYCLYCYSGGYVVGFNFEPMRSGVIPTPVNVKSQTMTGDNVAGETTIVVTQINMVSYVANPNFAYGNYYRVFSEFSSDL